MHPPHRPKRNESGEKSVSILVKTFFFLETTWIWAKKTFEFPISAEKSLSILVKTLFFFFFGDHLNMGEKNVWISDFGQKSLSILVKTSEFLRFCASNPPTKIFWIRHCTVVVIYGQKTKVIAVTLIEKKAISVLRASKFCWKIALLNRQSLFLYCLASSNFRKQYWHDYDGMVSNHKILKDKEL